MTLYHVAGFLVAILYLQAAGYFLLAMPRNKVNRVFVALLISLAWFSGGVFYLQLQQTIPYAYKADTITSFSRHYLYCFLSG